VFSCGKKEVVINKIPFHFGENNAEPNLVYRNGKLSMTWLSSVRKKEAKLFYTEYKNENWNKPISITSGKDWFVNWADFPANAINKNLLLTSYLKKSADGTYTYDVVLNLQNLKGEYIKKDFLLNTDGIKAEHGFVSMVPNKKNGFFITWLDGRNTVIKNHDGHHKPMTIRFAEISSTGIITNEEELDGSTCDCCQTSITDTKNGPVIVYRNRSESEIRDIFITRKIKDNWTKPVAVHNDNWKINGCPVNGPKIIVNENNLVTAWFTVKDDNPIVQIAFSDDYGVKFDAPIKVSEKDAIGRVDVVFLNKDEVLVSYMETDAVSTFLKCKKVHKSGKISEDIIIAKIDSGRNTGVPQLEIFKDEIIAVWTTSINDKNQLKSVKFSL
jgi:hypothetical protein